MKLKKRPYLIAPKLYEQPTWGGSLIGEHKGWQDRPEVKGKKIGQSYELYDGTVLVEANSSQDALFGPEGSVSGFPIADVINELGKDIVGPTVADTFESRLLLIKFTQAMGNSFQLHVRRDRETTRWKAKPESWYYLKPGALTLGVKAGMSVAAYKQACVDVYEEMKRLSSQVVAGSLGLEEAKKQGASVIARVNPLQYVNEHTVRAYTLVDLSGGELHHSWQEHPEQPWGNFVYEVQRDVKDEFCTLRSFDQGKFKDDGTIRELTIEDYFANLNPDAPYNSLENHLIKPNGEKLLSSHYYSMDELHLSASRAINLAGSYEHVWVRDGVVVVGSADGVVTLTQGHSAFIPWHCGMYTIAPKDGRAVVLRTYVG